MAVPALAYNISLRGIRNEFYNNNYNGSVIFSNISLQQASTGGYGIINTNNSISNRPDTLAPHSMDEFRGYDHDKAPAGTTPQVSTSLCRWSCKTPYGDLNMAGNVNTSTSGHATTEYGFVWGTQSSTPVIGGFGVTKSVVGNSNYNGFYSLILQGNQIMMPCCCQTIDYYIRAYAINSIGTSYGVTRTVQVQDCGCGGGGPGGPGDPFAPI